jgi:hypothetical protein
VTTEIAPVGAGLSIAYVPHKRQAELHASRARFRIAIKGRQSGGTLAAVVEIVQFAMSHPRAQLYWVTAALSLKSRAWRALAQVIPAKLIRRKSEVDLSIELKNGARIQIRSADSPDTQLVSETLDGVVCDEFAQYDDQVWPMHIRPMLATTNGWALFVGTPRGHNWAHDLYLRGLADDPEWASFRWPSTASPYFTKTEYLRAKTEMPERIFAQEIEAEFVSGSGAVFRNIESCIGPLAQPDDNNVLGVDIAKVKDFTVLHVLNSRRETVFTDRFNRLDYGLQKTRIIDAYRRFNCRMAIVDSTGLGSPIVDDLRRSILVDAVNLTSGRKAELIEGLMILLDQGIIRIPNDETLLGELRAFTFETTPSGHDRYEAPSGRHDDHVIALALAAYGLRGYPLQPAPPAPDKRGQFERLLDDHVGLEMRRSNGEWVDGESDW